MSAPNKYRVAVIGRTGKGNYGHGLGTVWLKCDRAGHVNRAFLGMKVLDGGPLPAGAKVFHDGQEVGVVTSSCHSPRLGAPIALGYLRWKHQEVGTRMEAETPTGRQAVEVLGMPPVR